MELLLILAAIGAVVYFVSRSQKSTTRHRTVTLDDAKPTHGRRSSVSAARSTT